MIIRVTDLTQVPDEELQALGESFVSEAKLPGGFKVETFKRNWTMILGQNMGALWLIRDGAIIGALGAILHPDINDDQMVAQETFWFVAPKHRGGMAGLRLLNEFELWAAMHGAKRIMVEHLWASMPEKVSKIFERRGYSGVATVHMKTL